MFPDTSDDLCLKRFSSLYTLGACLDNLELPQNS